MTKNTLLPPGASPLRQAVEIAPARTGQSKADAVTNGSRVSRLAEKVQAVREAQQSKKLLDVTTASGGSRISDIAARVQATREAQQSKKVSDGTTASGGSRISELAVRVQAARRETQPSKKLSDVTTDATALPTVRLLGQRTDGIRAEPATATKPSKTAATLISPVLNRSSEATDGTQTEAKHAKLQINKRPLKNKKEESDKQRIIKFPNGNSALRRVVNDRVHATPAGGNYKIFVGIYNKSSEVESKNNPENLDRSNYSNIREKDRLEHFRPNGIPQHPLKDQPITSMATVGDLVRRTRRFQDLSQSELASRAGTGRRFIADLEAGKPTVEFERVLNVFNALGLNVRVGS